MATMKKTMDFILAELLTLPALLVFNESEHLWVNVIGLAYIGAMSLFFRSSKGKRYIDRLMTYL